jgi:hypothetical protein
VVGESRRYDQRPDDTSPVHAADLPDTSTFASGKEDLLERS